MERHRWVHQRRIWFCPWRRACRTSRPPPGSRSAVCALIKRYRRKSEASVTLTTPAYGWGRWNNYTHFGCGVSEKEATRAFLYHKVKAGDNSANLSTKALDHASIVKHTEAMGGEFMAWVDPLAFTVNSISARVSMEKLAQDVVIRVNTIGRIDAWKRTNLNNKTFTTTNKGRPTWENVAHKVTADARSGNITNIDDATNINRDMQWSWDHLVDHVRQQSRWPPRRS